MVTIRTSDNVRFELRNDRMVETNSNSPYYAYRRRVREALKVHAKNPLTASVPYFFNTFFNNTLIERVGWLGEGKTQRGKKFLSIGCMKFVGKNRTSLIKWAKAKAKATRGNE